MYICIYIYIYRYVSPASRRGRDKWGRRRSAAIPPNAPGSSQKSSTANLRTNIMDFRGFDSSAIINFRGELPRHVGVFPEIMSQAILAGIILVGRLGVLTPPLRIPPSPGLRPVPAARHLQRLRQTDS